MKLLEKIRSWLGPETRTEHCKFYSELSLKRAIEAFQKREGFSSFSDACRSAMLNSPEIQHELTVLFEGGE